MISNQVVIKPWGREYCAYRNAEVAIWVLEIQKGEATSLHCHPKKNTALIVLQGEIELSFLRDIASRKIIALDKINIFHSRFHRTKAVSDDVVLLEVEAPDDKRDILRLDDAYGRAGDLIEEATAPLDMKRCLQIKDGSPTQRFANCGIGIIKPDSIWELTRNRIEDKVFVTLTGGLEYGQVPPGEAIDGTTMVRLVKAFTLLPDTTFLQIWKLP